MPPVKRKRGRPKKTTAVKSKRGRKKSSGSNSSTASHSDEEKSGENTEDTPELMGDPSALYASGDVVWAKYGDYPFWPGRVMRSIGRAKRGVVRVKWFGDFDGRTDECSLVSVLPFTSKLASLIKGSVMSEDLALFHSSIRQARSALSELREEKGFQGSLTPEPVDVKTTGGARRSSRIHAAVSSASDITAVRGPTTRSRKRKAQEMAATEAAADNSSLVELHSEVRESLETILRTHSPEDVTPFVYHMYHTLQAKADEDEALSLTAAAWNITPDNAKYHINCYNSDFAKMRVSKKRRR